MRILVLFAHPSRSSFGGAILAAVLDELEQVGHDVELLDLYAENFDPVLREEEWRSYEHAPGPSIQKYADQLRRSDGVIWVFPTWNYGVPAMLKGYVDRVWKPNVAFRLDDARNVHFDQFANLKFFFVATTYGASWLVNTFCGNPCKRMIAGGLRRHFPRSSRFVWLPIYNLDKQRPEPLRRHLVRVRAAMRACLSR